MPKSFHDVRELHELVKAELDPRKFYIRYFPNARVSNSRIRVACQIPSHAHSGKGHPGLSINFRNGLFHCFSRDEGGDIFRFHELMRGLTFAEAVRDIASEFALADETVRSSELCNARASTPRDYNPSDGSRIIAQVGLRFLEICGQEDQTAGIRYLSGRGISLQAVEKTRITYFPRRSYKKVMRALTRDFEIAALQEAGLFNQGGRLTFYRHRLIFPFFTEGQVTYLQARSISPDVNPRWHNMSKPVSSLYNADSLEEIPSGSTVFLVEGFTDTLTLLTHGFNAVGIVGAGGLKDEWLPFFGRFSVVCALDSDAAGDAAARRYQQMFQERGLSLARLRLQGDINDYFGSNPAASVQIALLAEACLETAESD
jgi:DNA primase